MKWPNSVTVLRHGQSAYNVLKAKKMADPEYLEFVADYEAKRATIFQAQKIKDKYALNVSDYKTPMTDVGKRQAFITGQRASLHIPKPDVVFYSPYERTVETNNEFAEGWKESNLWDIPMIADDRLREQEHGLSLLYNDWRVFHVFHPEQRELHEMLGMYAYQYPQGESTAQVRERARQFMSMLIRECAEMNVLVVTHHLWKLSLRANMERLTPEQFQYLDDHEKPVNCGLTQYLGSPNLGRNGKLVLNFYNKQLYTNEEVA